MCMVLGNQPKTPKDNLQSEQNSKVGEKVQDMEKTPTWNWNIEKEPNK